MTNWLSWVFVLVFLSACSDQVTQRDSDVRKYGELVPFVEEFGDFINGHADLDAGVLEARYAYNKKVSDLKTIAEGQGWEIKELSQSVIVLHGRYSGRSSSLRLELKGNEQIALSWRALP